MKKLFKILFIIILSVGIVALGFFVANKINEQVMIAYIDGFSPVEKDTVTGPEVDEDGSYYFTTDGEFKILQLTDIHIGGGVISSGNDKMALNAVAAMVRAEKPDLVVVTGDISFAIPTTGTLDNSYAHSFFIRLMERLGVYWTVTFGNHDSEKYNYHDRAAVAKMYEDESLVRCLFNSGSDDIFGECNHVINVKSTDGIVTKSLVMIDTNSYTEDDIFGLGWSYDRIHDDQIAWYEQTVERIAGENASVYELLSDEKKAEYDGFITPKTLVFMHIPIKEVKYAYEEYVNNNRQNTENTEYLGGHDGESDKVVYCPEEDEDFFEVMSELGSGEALFFGHDHLNNFVLEYKGVTFSYGYSIDYLAYSGISELGYQRGCTVISFTGTDAVAITHENYYSDKYVSTYPKETVEMTK